MAAQLDDESLSSFAKALEIEPKLRNARLGVARALFQTGKEGDAKEILLALREEHPNDAEVVVALAIVLAECEESEAALAFLNELRSPPATASFFAVRGGLNLANGRFQSAVGDLRKAISKRSDWVHIRNILGLAELKLGRLGAAERHFREAIRLAPFYEEPFLNLLRTLALQGRTNDLTREVESFYDATTAPAAVSRIVGSALLQASKFRRAIRWLNGALAKFDDDAARARVFNDLGYAWGRLGDHAQAGTYFERSVAILPEERSIVNRGKAFLLAGAPLLTIAWFDRLRSTGDGPFVDRKKTLARAYFDAGLLSQALVELRDILASADADADTFALATGLLADDAGELEEAIQTARVGLVQFPNHTTLLNNLAYALLMLEQVEEAAHVIREVLTGTQEERTFLTATRGLLALKRGDIQLGRSLYEQALASAANERTRSRIRAKRDLEVGRALLKNGNMADAVVLLQRASTEGALALPYSRHAQGELKRLG